jgi:RNA polymerase sigma-70 factor (ECF subfamily)
VREYEAFCKVEFCTSYSLSGITKVSHQASEGLGLGELNMLVGKLSHFQLSAADVDGVGLGVRTNTVAEWGSRLTFKCWQSYWATVNCQQYGRLPKWMTSPRKRRVQLSWLTIFMPEVLSSDGSAADGELESLAEDLRAGHEAAFEAVVRQFGGRMLAVARRILGNEIDAQDAVQDAFLVAFRSLGRFEGRSTLATWLHRIAVNCALMRIRSQKRSRERPIEDFLPQFLADGHRQNPGSAWAITYDSAVADNETRELVRQSIDALPESYRLILLLRDIEERTTEETAELLELSVANVKTRLHRARQALRELLDQHFG